MRRFIYLDTDTLNSYLAQIFDGLIQSQEMEKSAGKKEEKQNMKKATRSILSTVLAVSMAAAACPVSFAATTSNEVTAREKANALLIREKSLCVYCLWDTAKRREPHIRANRLNSFVM